MEKLACEGFFFVYRPSKQFSIMSGRSHRFLCITSTFEPCEGNKHTCTSEKTLCEGDSMRIERVK